MRPTEGPYNIVPLRISPEDFFSSQSSQHEEPSYQRVGLRLFYNGYSELTYLGIWEVKRAYDCYLFNFNFGYTI